MLMLSDFFTIFDVRDYRVFAIAFRRALLTPLSLRHEKIANFIDSNLDAELPSEIPGIDPK